MMLFKDVLEIKNGKNQRAVEDPAGQYPIYGSGGVMGRADDYICKADTVIIGRKGNINKPIYVQEPFWNVDTAFGLEANRSILLPRYLYYFCLGFDFERLNKAVTIPSLTKADLLKIEINLPEMDKQADIVNRLDKVENIIALRKRQLQALDNLIKARFVEMFGDPNELDKYANARIRDVASSQVGIVIKPTRFYSGDGVGTRVFRSLNIAPFRIIDNSDWVHFSEDGMNANQRTIVHEGDVLVVRSGNPGTSCVVSKEYDGCNVIDLIIAHPDVQKILPEYLCAFTNMPHGMNQINNQQHGVAQRHFNVTMYENMKIYVPDIAKQHRFVDFLHQVDKSKVAE